MLLHHSGDARDLAVSNRVLAYALANNAEVRGASERVTFYYAVRHVRRRQRAICEALGFPGTEAFVRLLRKIPPETCTPSMLRVLQKAVRRDPGIPAGLSHLQRITPAIVYLVGNDDISRLITPRLLVEAAGAPNDTMAAVVAEKLFKILDCARRMRPAPRLHGMQSAKGIDRLHERLTLIAEAERARAMQALAPPRPRAERTRQRDAENGLPAWSVYPPPPFPGNADIVPIANRPALRLEGRQQHNCVEKYVCNVSTTQFYIYRVMRPERATLSIVRKSGGWTIDQLRLSHNRAVSPPTVAAVRAWLCECNTARGAAARRGSPR